MLAVSPKRTSLAIASASRLVAERHHGEHGPEDLLLGEPHAGVHAVEERGPDEEAVGELGRSGPRAPGDQPRALRLAELDVAADLLELRLAHERADLGRVVLGQPDAEAVDPLRERSDERLVDVRVHDQPRGRAARLPGEAEVHAAHDAVERRVEIGVGEHHDRVLAAALERHVLDRDAGGPRLDRAARLGERR